MRALGPGSVSSFLKVVLDVVYIAVWTVFGAVVLSAVALLIFQPFTISLFKLDLGRIDQSGAMTLVAKAPAVAGLLLITSIYLGVLITIINRLRRIFETLTQGDPFRRQNVRRLRVVGLALIALEGVGFVVHVVSAIVLSRPKDQSVVYLNVTTWFAILVVFVLAEVFREGARLRDEAELTI